MRAFLSIVVPRIAGLLPLLILAACARQPVETAEPGARFRDANLMLIMIDTLRADHCSLYGYERPTTPHLERLARTSYVFESCYASASWTRPSIASFFTGRLPGQHGAVTRTGRLAESETTLAELLAARGYATVGWYGNPNIHPSLGLAQGFESYETYAKRRIAADEAAVCTAPGITSIAREWLEAWTVDDRRRPFFLYLHYMDPHEPYFHHPAHDFDPSYEGEAVGSVTWLREHKRLEPRDKDHIRALYDGEIRYMDAHVGAVLSKLDQLDLRDETIIVVTADHGEGLWSHRTRDHGHEVYEEQVRVPLLVALPGHRGRRVQGLVRSIDLLPTLAELMGLETPEGVQGQSLIPLVTGEERGVREVFIHEVLDGHNLAAVRDARYKVILDIRKAQRLKDRGRLSDRDRLGKAVEIYDLEADPAEKHAIPLALAPQPARRLVQGLLDRFDEISAEAVQARQADPGVLDPEILEGLRALGYIE